MPFAGASVLAQCTLGFWWAGLGGWGWVGGWGFGAFCDDHFSGKQTVCWTFVTNLLRKCGGWGVRVCVWFVSVKNVKST